MSAMEKKPTDEVKPSSPSETPSAASGSSAPVDDTSERPKKARRTFLTQNACSRCRQKKSKCDGKRPICARCEKHGAECKYDVAQEGITRMQHLQQQIESKTQNLARFMTLFHAMQTGTDQEATTLLARLRLGESIDELLSSVGALRPPSPEAPSTESPPPSLQSPDLDGWSLSPTLDGSSSWSRAPTDSRRLSQASESRAIGQRLLPSHRHTDSTLTVRAEFRQHQHQHGTLFFQSTGQLDLSRTDPEPLSPIQWPKPLFTDGISDFNPSLTLPTKTLPSSSELPSGENNQYTQLRQPQRRGTEPCLPVTNRPWPPLPDPSRELNIDISAIGDDDQSSTSLINDV